MTSNIENEFFINKFKNRRLDSLLVDKKLVTSRKEAVSLIMTGGVFVEEKKVDKPGKIIKLNQKISLKKFKKDWVSRGGYKLDAVLKRFKLDVKNKVCMDIGCSSGGFSDVLIKGNVKRIYAIDVGYGQFDWKLRKKKEIILLEKTNARYLTKKMITEEIDLIVCDVSFISAKKVLEPNKKFLGKKFEIIVLLKPQFEVGRKNVGKGGIVKNFKIHEDLCENFENWIKKTFEPNFCKFIESPIKGQKGNKEFLFYFGEL
jgi:23S rRNA (cytidine1920-2'-O)/16S rRNA (cytidine1409-2'-O)-methyltransferase|tara:strand:- start:2797 stop:3573 length:777 start_codon:yes stop_codon:yes gene_type:complete